MRKFLYKALCYGKLKVSICLYTSLFKIVAWLNEVKVGKKVVVAGAVPLLQINRNSGLVSIGSHTRFNSYQDVGWYSKCCLIVREGAELTIDDYSGMSGVMVFAANKINIGRHVNIGGGTRIFDTNFHPTDWQERRKPLNICPPRTAPVIIEDDVFIGTNCIICKGVTIGARSIVAAGSVVVKSIPADEIWGGNPAKCIRKAHEELS